MVSSANEISIPVIPGDGVGPEITEAALQCMEALIAITGSRITFKQYPAGYAAYSKTGDPLPEETLQVMRTSPATLLGGISVKECPPPSPTGRMRKELGLFTDIRHCFSVPGSPRQGVDLVIVRECSEGFLSDRNMFAGSGEFMPTPDVVTSVRLITRQKCDAISRVAYEYAKKHNRKKVTVVHKNTVFPLGCGLFRERALEQARRYPEIETEEMFPDALARELVLEPERFDVILTTNLFGDILSEVAAAQVGNLVPTVNASNDAAVFSPSHGAMISLAGKQTVNPLAMLYTVCMMLGWLGLQEERRLLEQALAHCHNAAYGASATLPAGITTQTLVDAVIREIKNLQ
jgi:isocitrate/isopropylmalate dehydrogenase